MKDTSKIRFVTDVDVTEKELRVRKPFRISQENQRRFIRLEISSPMSLRKVKDVFGNFWPNEDGEIANGTILNISAGGVLVEVDSPINEGDLVAMHFTLQDVEGLDNVLGLVKRSDADEDEDIYLTGIEFISQNRLQDLLSTAELDLLTDGMSDFNHTVQEVLNKYVYQQTSTADAQ